MPVESIIGRGTVVRGNVRGEGDLDIQGRVEGDVIVEGDVTLGAEAVVRGQVTAAQISVSGTVQGDLRGSQAVLIERGARVVGDLLAPRIGIAPGALVRGTVRTEGEAPLAQAQPQRRPAALSQPVRGVASTTPRAVAFPAREGRNEAAPRGERADTTRATPLPDRAERSERAERTEEAAPVRERLEAPPPPVVPSLAKSAKAKKKRRED